MKVWEQVISLTDLERSQAAVAALPPEVPDCDDEEEEVEVDGEEEAEVEGEEEDGGEEAERESDTETSSSCTYPQAFLDEIDKRNTSGLELDHARKASFDNLSDEGRSDFIWSC
jgi:hypothetical protein